MLSGKWSGVDLGRVVLLASAYLVFAFAFSFVGFVAQQPAIHLHEYSLPEAIVEVGGHLLFGAVVAAPLLRIDASLVSAGFAVGIDADHVLGALNLNVSSRPDHSVAFCLFAMGAMWFVANRIGKGMPQIERLSIVALVPASILSHISYDIFAGYSVFNGVGFSFPLWVPFSFQLTSFPYWDWVYFEAAGAGVIVIFALMTRRRQGIAVEPKSVF